MKQIHPFHEAALFQGCFGPFLVVWLCGWVVVEYILWATMFGADIRWQGGNVPPLWSLIIFTAFWTAVGVRAIWRLIRLWHNRI